MLEQAGEEQQTTAPLLFLNNVTSTIYSDPVTLPDVGPEEETRSFAERVVWSVVIVVILLASLIGNLLVIVCACRHHRLREEQSNLFIVNLSVTDMCNAVIVMMSSLHAMASDQWHMGQVMCSIVGGTNYTLIVVSMLTLCFISLDRYMAVQHALYYHVRVTRTKIYILLGCAWVQGLCFGLVPILAGWIKYDYWEVICAILWQIQQDHLLSFVCVGFAICFALPSTVMVIAYCKVMNTALAQNTIQPQAQQRNAKARSSVSKQNGVSTRKATSVPTNQHNEASSLPLAPPQTDQSSNALASQPINSANSAENDSMTSQVFKLATSDASPEGLHISHPEASGSSWPDAAVSDMQHNPLNNSCKDLKTTEGLHQGTTILTNIKQRPKKQTVTFYETPHSNSDESKLISSMHSKNGSSQGIYNIAVLPSECTPTTGQSIKVNTNLTLSSNSQLTCPVSVSSNEASKPCYSNKTAATARNRFQIFRKKSSIGQSSDKTKVTKRNYSTSNKAVKSLMIIMIAYFICMTPFCITKLYKVIFPLDVLPGYVNLVSSIFQYLSSAINPLIYGIFRKDFQRALLLLAKRFFVKFNIAENSTTDFQSGSF